VWESDAAQADGVAVDVGSVKAATFTGPKVLASWVHIRQPPPVICRYDGLRDRAHASDCGLRRLPRAEPQVSLSAVGGAVAWWERASAYKSVTQAAAKRKAGSRWQTSKRFFPAGASFGLNADGESFGAWSTMIPSCALPCTEGTRIETSPLGRNGRRAK
jgi:hypothetical protein